MYVLFSTQLTGTGAYLGPIVFTMVTAQLTARVTQKVFEQYKNLNFIIFTYFDPNIRSASGAPFGGIYFGFFSLLKFKPDAGGVRLVTFVINSIQKKNIIS